MRDAVRAKTVRNTSWRRLAIGGGANHTLLSVVTPGPASKMH